MTFQRKTLASAIALMLAAPSIVWAQTQDKTLPTVTVTATPFGADETAQIIAPAKVLSGDELRAKEAGSLGATLMHELGVSATSFGARASRPVIRGLEGPRVKILQNGMAVSDVSTMSNDHAVAVETSSARQIEILRGPAALLYGSGAIGGLVNVVNERIPTELLPRPTGEAELRFGTVDKARNLSFSVDGATDTLGLHVDGHARSSNDYRIPGHAVLGDSASASGTLPSSFTRSHSLGFGISHIASWGYVGTSIATLDDRYGIPTAERSFIDLSQQRFDVDGLIRQPWNGFESFRFRLGATDYRHIEKEEDGTPATDFRNRALESRWEWVHAPLAGWRGSFGLQTEHGRLSALAAETGRPDTIPITKSSSIAAFLVEERDFGPVRASAGLRLESVRRNPEGTDLAARRFSLASYSIGGLWTFLPGYGAGATFSMAQRAPSTEELYSNGPHESTATFVIGDAALGKETSRNIELSLQKTEGLLRWKANLFHNRVRNFVFGRLDGTLVDEDGSLDPDAEFLRRFWSQGDATIRGAELEISYNLNGNGFSWRGFADTSRGTLDGAGNLPLQPATRFGLDANYKQGGWRGGISVVHAQGQNRLAAFEGAPTPSYTQLDASASYGWRAGGHHVSVFAIARNLLNRDIRLSTSILRDVAPQPGRNFIVGVRTRF